MKAGATPGIDFARLGAEIRKPPEEQRSQGVFVVLRARRTSALLSYTRPDAAR